MFLDVGGNMKSEVCRMVSYSAGIQLAKTSELITFGYSVAICCHIIIPAGYF